MEKKQQKPFVTSNKVFIKIDKTEVTFFKNSNEYKIGDKIGYLKQIVWEEVTEEIINEVKEYLQK